MNSSKCVWVTDKIDYVDDGTGKIAQTVIRLRCVVHGCIKVVAGDASGRPVKPV